MEGCGVDTTSAYRRITLTTSGFDDQGKARDGPVVPAALQHVQLNLPCPISLYTCRAGGKTVTKSGSNWGPEELELFRIDYKRTRDPHWPHPLPLSPLPNNSLWTESFKKPTGFPDESTKISGYTSKNYPDSFLR
jgi:hypothetical protein